MTRNYPPAPRTPEDNIKVFEIGHYEQMQVAIAFDMITDLEPLDGLDVDVIRALRHIFDAYGTITIIRTNQED